MMVQWCVKGLALRSDDDARAILNDQNGLLCNWWRQRHQIARSSFQTKLTPETVDQHVNHFSAADPDTGRPFNEESPYISLSAGCVGRDALLKSNYVHRARRTAIWFGSRFLEADTAYVFVCWVVVAPRAAVQIEGVAEEVRDLNIYRRYSEYQTEGEILAKICVPDNQVRHCEKWQLRKAAGVTTMSLTDVFDNPRFTSPQQLSNVKDLI